jgi:hypothetical protein
MLFERYSFNPALAVIALLFLNPRMAGYARSVSVHPVADTTITQKSSLKPNTLDVGTTGPSGGTKSSRSLIKFDIAGNIPSNATITSAALTLTVVDVPATPANSIFDMRAVLLNWSETDATWTNRLIATPWSVLGGAIGVDFSNKISQTNFFGNATGLSTFVSSSNLVADVQNWLQNPDANFGWVIISELQGTPFTQRTFASREDTANAATLLVQYTVPALPPTITVISTTNGIFKFSFNAETNRAYAVQSTSSLTNTIWNVLTNFSASAIPTNFIAKDPLNSSNRFYRVQTP